MVACGGWTPYDCLVGALLVRVIPPRRCPGTSFVTTAAAATTASSPRVTPGRMVASEPTRTFRPMTMGPDADRRACERVDGILREPLGSRTGADYCRYMERVQGIGGVFFSAADPELLSLWYARHLGIDPPPASYDSSSWQQSAGATVFSGLPLDSEHFPPGKSWAVTFRVADLAAMVRQLEAAGIPVDRDDEVYPNGLFATLLDPEGNRIQLWEQAGSDA